MYCAKFNIFSFYYFHLVEDLFGIVDFKRRMRKIVLSIKKNIDLASSQH